MTYPALDIVPAPPTAAVIPARGYWGRVWRQVSRDPVTIACATILILIILAAIFAPYVAPFDPNKTSMINRLKPFGYRDYILGSDELGRDMLSRLLYGGRLSLVMGVMPVVAGVEGCRRTRVTHAAGTATTRPTGTVGRTSRG